MHIAGSTSLVYIIRNGTRAIAELRDVLLGDKPPAFDPPAPFTPLDAALNPSQQEMRSVSPFAQDVAIIHGPPGTGKTTTVVEVIRQRAAR